MGEPTVEDPQEAGATRLRRPEQGRMVAGVAAGVAEHLRVDVTLVRVLFVIAGLFNLIGVVAYGVLWMLMPSTGDDAKTPGGVRALGSPRNTGTWVGIALVAVGGLWLASWGAFGLWGRGQGLFLPLLLVGGGLALWLSEDRRSAAAHAGANAPWDAGAATTRTAHHAGDSSGTRGTAAAQATSPTTAATAWDRTPSGGPVGPPPASPPPPAGPGGDDGGHVPPPPVRERSPLVRLTLGVALVVAGAGWLAGATGLADVSLEMVLGLALAVVAAGLLVGAWWGRARLLVLVGVPLSVAVLVVVAVPVVVPAVPLSGTVGVVDLTIDDADDLASDYEHVAGAIRLDLRELELEDSATTRLAVGAGEVEVVLPDDLGVEVDAAASVGQLMVLDEQRVGVGPSLTLRDGGGEDRLILEARVGAGEIRITRDSFAGATTWSPAMHTPSVSPEPTMEVAP